MHDWYFASTTIIYLKRQLQSTYTLRSGTNLSGEFILTIEKISKKYQISADTLRYYEKEGLIPYINCTENGIRNYTEEGCTRIGFDIGQSPQI